MDSFRPPAPLRLDSANLEAEWTSFEKKFKWFLVAIGADKKPDATKLAMLLTTVGDDAVKVFEAFTYAEGEVAEQFDVVVRKFKERVRRYAIQSTNVIFSGNTARSKVRLSINTLLVSAILQNHAISWKRTI